MPPYEGRGGSTMWTHAFLRCFTYGGLSVDGETHVLDEDGHPITGLYAAGEIAGTFYNEYPSGTSGLRSMTFGRVAGIVTAREAAARRVPVTV